MGAACGRALFEPVCDFHVDQFELTLCLDEPRPGLATRERQALRFQPVQQPGLIFDQCGAGNL